MHSKDDVERIYMTRKEERKFTGNCKSMHERNIRLNKPTKQGKERLLTAANNSKNQMNTRTLRKKQELPNMIIWTL